MKLSDEPLRLGRGILAGLFTGMITAVIILAFDIIYRGAARFYSYSIVMPVSIFMAFPLFNLVAGGVYYLFVGHLRRGRMLFSLITLLVMVLLALVTAFTGHQTDPENEKFRGMLLGFELIEGLMAALMIPFFAGHPTLFLTDKDIRGER